MEKDKLGYYLERKDVIERYFRDGQFVDAEREVLRLRKEMEEDADVPEYAIVAGNPAKVVRMRK